ncbi:MAG: N-acetylmannosamine-6-phosphate 2-epimerase [Tissierellia bacterium]|nr:N-acetylmannosamine-6-phosphate 2-epimerase [Tissierellia bacterium]
MRGNEIIEGLQGGLVVSCQALPGEPMFTEEGHVMPLFAKAAMEAGAVGIRASSGRDIRQIKEIVDLPVIGLVKKSYGDAPQYITVTLREVEEVLEAGAEIVAVDATDRPRHDGKTIATYFAEIRRHFPHVLLMADIATYAEGILAWELGADIISTTMSGYTQQSLASPKPNLELVRQLAAVEGLILAAEGHIHSPADGKRMLDAGADFVVVGGAITRPLEIARRFVSGLQLGR